MPDLRSASVHVVLVTWNGVEHTLDCLDSLRRLRFDNYRVVVVDNASTDATLERVTARYPDVRVLARERNDGFAAGCNAGIEDALASGATYVWLLNPDTTVDADALVAHVDAAERLGRPAILAPKIFYRDEPEVIWSVGGGIDRSTMKDHHIGIGQADGGQYNALRRVDWASGCSLFFGAEVVERAGLMDERYFLYLEDVDWCLTAAAVGVPVFVVPEARVWHRVSSSVNTISRRLVRYYSWRNYYLLASKHGAPAARLRVRADLYWRFVKIVGKTLLVPASRRDSLYHARTRGLFDALRGRYGRAALPHEPDDAPGYAVRSAEGMPT